MTSGLVLALLIAATASFGAFAMLVSFTTLALLGLAWWPIRVMRRRLHARRLELLREILEIERSAGR